MSKPLESTIEPGEEPSDAAEGSQLSSPTLDPETGKPKNKAISSFQQAYSIAKKQFENNKRRINDAAIIADKYGGSAPYKNSDLAATGQDWRNNFSTNPLGSTVDRSTPQIVDPIKQAEFLTYSALSADREQAAEKTRAFRTKTTKLVRSWNGFVTLICNIAQEDYLFGNCAPGWIDDNWRPKAFRYDETFLPDGSGQHSTEAQFVIYKQPILLHDFLSKIDDKEVAIDAGYDWDGCIKAANESAGLRTNTEESPLTQVDREREGGAIGATYDSDTKYIWVYHILVREYTGGVNLWTVECSKGHAIRYQEGIHESMEDATTLFTLQEGNMKYYGSKGAGRILTNIHIALDRGRNAAHDQVYLSGLMVIQADETDMNSIQPTVRHPFIVIPKGCTVIPETVEFKWEGYQYMDAQLSQLMEQLAGSFIPPNIVADAGANTKIEAAQKAERELAVKNGVLGRWFGQFANMMSAMQRKIYKPENLKEAKRIFDDTEKKKKTGVRVIAKRVYDWLKNAIGATREVEASEVSSIADPEAVQCIVELLQEGLSLEEITELALCPAGNNVEEHPEEQDSKTVTFLDSRAGNPMYDQRKVQEMTGRIVIGEDRINAVLLPDQIDPNVEAIQTRTQINEWMAMMTGEFMPVASTDNHMVHRNVLEPKMIPMIQSMTVNPTPDIAEASKMMIQHFADHIAADASMTDEQKAPEMEKVMAWQQAVLAGDKILEKQAQDAAAAGVQGGAMALPPGQPDRGQPLMPAPKSPDQIKMEAEVGLRLGDQQIQHRKLDLEERKLQQQDEHHGSTLAVDTLKTASEKLDQATRDGIKDANAEAQQVAEQQNPNNPQQ